MSDALANPQTAWMLQGAAGSSVTSLDPGGGGISPSSHTSLTAYNPCRGRGSSEEMLLHPPFKARPPKYLDFEEIPVTDTDGASQNFHHQLIINDVDEIKAASI